MLVCSLDPPLTAEVAAMTATTKFKEVFWKMSERTPASEGAGATTFRRPRRFLPLPPWSTTSGVGS